VILQFNQIFKNCHIEVAVCSARQWLNLNQLAC